MKKIALSTGLAAILIAGCGGGGEALTSGEDVSSGSSPASASQFPLEESLAAPSSEAEDVPAEGDDLPVSDVLYIVQSFTSDIYVQFGFTAENPNTDLGAALPTFRVTARAEDGSILDTQDEVLFGIAPGATVAWTSQLSVAEEPASVEVVFVQADWVPWPPPGEEVPSFTASNVSGRQDGSYYTVTGEVTNESSSTVESARVSAILRDEADAVVGYGQGYVNGLPANSPTPFTLDAWFASKPDSVEILAEQW